MKKCAYCAKEIDYHEMYCSDECQADANAFYDMRQKNQSAFSALNGICVIGIGICFFLYAFLPAAAVIAGAACTLILGAMYLLLPFPADVMIEKYKLKKALFLTRCVAGGLLFIGAAVLILHFVGLM